MNLDASNAQFAVVKTAFHNGGTLSFHNSLDAARKAALYYQDPSCSCGCCDVVPVTKEAQKILAEFETPTLYADLPEWQPGKFTPYQLCR